jgi:hypothetical protein
MDFFSVTQRLTACGKVDVIIVERHQKSADLSLSGGAMRTIRDDDSKTVKPKKKINAKIKTVRLRANLKLTHWYEKAALSISAAPSRPSAYKSHRAVRRALAIETSGSAP